MEVYTEYLQGCEDHLQPPPAAGPPLLGYNSAPLHPRDSLSSQLARLSLGSRQGLGPGSHYEETTPSPQDGTTSAPGAPSDTFPFKKTRRGKRAGRNLKLRNAESELRRKSADLDSNSPLAWQARAQDGGPLTPRASLSNTPRTAPATPMSAPSPLGPRLSVGAARMSPGTPPPPAAGSTVWGPARSHVPAASPWDSPQPMSLSPYALDRHSLDFLSPLTSLDSAHDGRADAAWGEQPEDLSRAAMGKLRPTGSAPNSLSRRLHFPDEQPWPLPRHSIATQPQLGLMPRIESSRALIPAGPDSHCSPLARVPTWEGLADAACQLPFTPEQLR